MVFNKCLIRKFYPVLVLLPHFFCISIGSSFKEIDPQYFFKSGLLIFDSQMNENKNFADFFRPFDRLRATPFDPSTGSGQRRLRATPFDPSTHRQAQGNAGSGQRKLRATQAQGNALRALRYATLLSATLGKHALRNHPSTFRQAQYNAAFLRPFDRLRATLLRAQETTDYTHIPIARIRTDYTKKNTNCQLLNYLL